MNAKRHAEESQGKELTTGPNERDVLLAILAILVDDREARASERPKQAKTEILLADAGLAVSTIATLLNKQPAAVRMSIARARTRKGADTKAGSNRS